MKSVENKETRLEMVDMHKFFLDKINNAIEEKRYVEASWLIYSCMENRFFRVLCKFKNQCVYSDGKCGKSKNELAISTKISCVRRMCQNNVICISNAFTIEQLDNISKWIKQRNRMMHDLLSLDTYEETDEEFELSALEGKVFLDELYESCTEFRKIFFSQDYIFEFPKAAMDGCNCRKSKKRKENIK